MKLRPARTMRYINSQAWSRYSVKKPRKNYVKALPHTSLLIFRMGVEKNDYDIVLTLNTDQYIQLRSNAIESARLVANKHLERNLPGQYFSRFFYRVSTPCLTVYISQNAINQTYWLHIDGPCGGGVKPSLITIGNTAYSGNVTIPVVPFA